MNKLFFAMALLFVGMSVNAQHLGSEYRLKKVIPVAGRQGIAIDKQLLLGFRHQSTVQIRQTGNLVMKNDQPFQRILKLPTTSVISISTMEKFTAVLKNSNTDVVIISPYRFTMQRL